MVSRRAYLHGIEARGACSHPGLALDRYLSDKDDDHKAEQELLDRVQGSVASDIYRLAFADWHTMLHGRKTCALHTGILATPLAVGLGNESAREVGLTTHHTYGMPYIPGTALKGLCRRGATAWKAAQGLEDKAFLQRATALFGDQDSASHFVFWDAWFDPTSVGGKPFHRDTVTVHHPDYYRSHGKEAWPTEFDDPTPVPFLVVRPGAQFLFAIDSPTREWGFFALNLLLWSLANLGVGAKTNAGYGYFEPVLLPPPPVRWPGVLLTYSKGPNKFTAIRQDRTNASVTGEAGKKIFETLPEPLKNQLRRHGEWQNVDVLVEPVGNGWKLVEIVTE